MRLIFADRSVPGISREAHGDGFRYFAPNGRPVGPRTLKRIEALVIPPAWRNVWIAPSAQAHIQATGVDAKGRLQYLYHPLFRQTREEAKFSRLLKFAQGLPKLRAAIAEDMRRRGIPRERALATLVHLLETTLIRIGNQAYARENASFGLCTLDASHVSIEGETLTFEFKGKSGKDWRVTIRDRRAATVMRACQELPGQQLFQYIDDEGRRRAITSADVNAYLRQRSGRRISTKDFRTWSGTLLCALALAQEPPHASERQLKRQIAAAVRAASRALGNTPAVCRSSYVHPAVLEAHVNGELRRHMARAVRQEPLPDRLKPEEEALLRLLRRFERAKKQTSVSAVAVTAAIANASAPAPA